ncbi:cytochrome P450 20A1-like [Glandiceps talaboti]
MAALAMAVIAVVILFVVMVFYYLKSLFGSDKSDGANEEEMKAVTGIPGMAKTDSSDGNLTNITAAGSFHEFLVKLHSRYGPVASFWYGRHYYVSFASPEAWKDHLKIFDRPPELFEFGKPLIGPESIQFANRIDGKERRKLYDIPFNHEAIRNYYTRFQRAADAMVEKISWLPPEEHIPLSEYMSKLVIKAFSNATFGDYFIDEESAIALLHHYETAMAILNKSISEDMQTNEEFDGALKSWHDMMRNVIQERCENPPCQEEWTFIDVLIENSPTEERLLSDAITYFIGGYHTTTFMMVWTLYYISKHQEFQDKVYKELIDVLGISGQVNNKTLTKLVYTKQVLDEAMRCSILAPFAARVNYDRDMRVLGYTIPKGTGVVHALGVVLQDPNIWPYPDRYDPDRFLPEETAKRHKLAFSPFGFAGERMCPGYRMTYAEGSVFLATLLRKFKFHLVEGQNIQRKFGFVTLPSEEIWVTVTRRE